MWEATFRTGSGLTPADMCDWIATVGLPEAVTQTVQDNLTSQDIDALTFTDLTTSENGMAALGINDVVQRAKVKTLWKKSSHYKQALFGKKPTESVRRPPASPPSSHPAASPMSPQHRSSHPSDSTLIVGEPGGLDDVNLWGLFDDSVEYHKVRSTMFESMAHVFPHLGFEVLSIRRVDCKEQSMAWEEEKQQKASDAAGSGGKTRHAYYLPMDPRADSERRRAEPTELPDSVSEVLFNGLPANAPGAGPGASPSDPLNAAPPVSSLDSVFCTRFFDKSLLNYHRVPSPGDIGFVIQLDTFGGTRASKASGAGGSPGGSPAAAGQPGGNSQGGGGSATAGHLNWRLPHKRNAIPRFVITWKAVRQGRKYLEDEDSSDDDGLDDDGGSPYHQGYGVQYGSSGSPRGGGMQSQSASLQQQQQHSGSALGGASIGPAGHSYAGEVRQWLSHVLAQAELQDGRVSGALVRLHSSRDKLVSAAETAHAAIRDERARMLRGLELRFDELQVGVENEVEAMLNPIEMQLDFLTTLRAQTVESLQHTLDLQSLPDHELVMSPLVGDRSQLESATTFVKHSSSLVDVKTPFLQLSFPSNTSDVGGNLDALISSYGTLHASSSSASASDAAAAAAASASAAGPVASVGTPVTFSGSMQQQQQEQQEQEHAATHIQAAFRGHASRAGPPPPPANKPAHPIHDSEFDADHAAASHISAPPPPANKPAHPIHDPEFDADHAAASHIQAAYRGHASRTAAHQPASRPHPPAHASPRASLHNAAAAAPPPHKPARASLSGGATAATPPPPPPKRASVSEGGNKKKKKFVGPPPPPGHGQWTCVASPAIEHAAPGAPTGRVMPTLTQLGDWLVVFGGSDPDSHEMNDMYAIPRPGRASAGTGQYEGDVLTSYSWVPLSADGQASITQRASHSTVAHEGSLFVFGGEDNEGNCLNDLWVFKADPSSLGVGSGGIKGSWECVCPSSPTLRTMPAPRISHTCSMLEGIMYVFGGETMAGPGQPRAALNDLWSFTVATGKWKMISANTGGGGRADPRFPQPEPRFGHSQGLVNRCLYVFGGSIDGDDAGGSLQNDVWEFNTETGSWERIFEDSPFMYPEGRQYNSCVAAGHCLFVFGGMDAHSGVEHNDMWAFDVLAREWHKSSPSSVGKKSAAGSGSTTPSKRMMQSMVACGASELYVFGGLADGTFLADLHRYTVGSQWHLLSSSDASTGGSVKPMPRIGSGLASLSDGSTYVFGGSDPDVVGRSGGAMNDLWCLDHDETDPKGRNMKWACAHPHSSSHGGELPCGRQQFAMKAERTSDRFFVFGGAADNDERLNDLWVYAAGKDGVDSGLWTCLSANGTAGAPPARAAASLAVLDGCVVVFGGDTGSLEAGEMFNNDVWVFDWRVGGGKWTEHVASVAVSAGSPVLWPEARSGHCCGMVEGKMYVTGGSVEDTEGGDACGSAQGDVWCYDAQEKLWSLAFNSDVGGGFPAGRSYSSCCAHGHSLYLFGGCDANGREENDLWSFTPGRLYQEWTCLHSGSHADSVKFPLPRIMHNLAIKGSAQNRMHDEVMVFGGMADGEVVNDMWIWMPSLTPF